LQGEEVDVLVTKFTCSTKIHSKDIAWRVQASRDLHPLEINAHVDKSILSSPEVSVACNDQKIFPTSSDLAKGKLLEDFRYQWPFRGTLREGLNEPRRFESRHPQTQLWYPAIITKQRGDGLFEVTLDVPDSNGFVRHVPFPAVSKNDIREIGSEETLHLSEQSVMLDVPKSDPLLAALSVNGHVPTTHCFGRHTPAVDQPETVASFKISDDRRSISANLGHSVLSHFLSGDVRNVTSDVQRHCRSWTIQIGPFAEHVVKISRHAWPSKVVTLTIDDDVLVDASAEDIGCATSAWECKFRFVGEKVMDFDVYESNLDGVALATRGHVTKRERYSHECSVLLKDDMDLSKAELIIDDVYFQDLPPKATQYEESNVSTSLDSFLATYGPIVPQKVNRTVATGFIGGLKACAAEGGSTGSSTAAAGVAVMRSAAKDAAISGAAAALNAAASGAEAVSAAAVDYSPIVADAAEKVAKKTGHNLSGIFSWCCDVKNVEDRFDERFENDASAKPVPKD
jgi:hypothetical protein